MSKKRGFIAALVAGVGGFVAGILSAPKSGKETREDIKDAATKARKETEAKLKSLHTTLSKQVKDLDKRAKTAKGKAKAELKELSDKADKAKGKIKEILSDFREGKAEDSDVEKAVREGETTKRKIAAAKRKTAKK